MCFGNKNEGPSDPAPRLAQVPQQPQQPHQSTASLPPTSKPPPATTSNMAQDDYAPPPGPPPSHRAGGPPPPDDYAPPPGPPPSQSRMHASGSGSDAYYAPPPGPPPSHHQYDYAPPAGPPPSSSEKTKNNPFFNDSHNGASTAAAAAVPPPPKDWEAVPDTALLPPPPSYFSGYDRSPANNATEEQAEAGEKWCRDFPLYPPQALDRAALDAALSRGDVSVFAPPGWRGQLARTTPGVWKGRSPPGGPDTHLATYPPLYSAATHGPTILQQPRTVYYEVRLLADSRPHEISLALGFAAPPYPPFRLPGWHRASLGVHGDDGHRYVNDRWGGRDFARPFRRGETVGLGMRFSPGAGGFGARVEVFLTRDGRLDGRWDLHEETDLNEDLPVTGLEGAHDLCAAVGVFDAVSFEVVFRPDLWAWKGDGL